MIKAAMYATATTPPDGLIYFYLIQFQINICKTSTLVAAAELSWLVEQHRHQPRMYVLVYAYLPANTMAKILAR